MTIIVGSDIPTGDEVKWYMGGAEATLVKEDLIEATVGAVDGVITLSNKAEFGSVFVVDADGNPTASMLEFAADAVTPATQADGTLTVKTSASGTATVTAYYIDVDTGNELVQVMACKDVSSNLSIDTKETEVHGQTQKLQKTGAATRTASLEEVDYNDDLVGVIFGDLVSDSPVAGDTKWSDNFTATKKISALVGMQYQSGVLIKKWFLMGCQVSKIDSSFPTADFYTKSMDFLVDYMVSTTLVQN